MSGGEACAKAHVPTVIPRLRRSVCVEVLSTRLNLHIIMLYMLLLQYFYTTLYRWLEAGPLPSREFLTPHSIPPKLPLAPSLATVT
jgi:hypothetical protein